MELFVLCWINSVCKDKLIYICYEYNRANIALTPCFPAISSTMGGIIIPEMQPIVFMIP